MFVIPRSVTASNVLKKRGVKLSLEFTTCMATKSMKKNRVKFVPALIRGHGMGKVFLIPVALLNEDYALLTFLWKEHPPTIKIP